MRLSSSMALLTLLCVVPVLPSAAATLTVPQQYTTIQAAVNHAQPGDTILISPKTGTDPTYHENVVIATQNITLEGTGGATLDGTGTGVAFVQNAGITVQADDVTVTGLTVQKFVRAQGGDPSGVGILV